MNPSTVEIPRSNRKTGLFAAFICLMACGSLYIAYDAEHIILNGVHSPPIVRFVGISGAVLLGCIGFVLAKQLVSKKPGLVLNAEGFIDNTSGAAAGLVAWADVVGLRDVKIGFFHFIAVMLRDPAKYVARPTQGATRQLFQNYLNQYGTPLLLSTNMLQCTPDELKTLLAARIAQ